MGVQDISQSPLEEMSNSLQGAHEENNRDLESFPSHGQRCSGHRCNGFN